MKTLKRKTLIVSTVVILLFIFNCAFANDFNKSKFLIEEKTILYGKVSAEGLVKVGQIVKKGTPLVKLENLLGAMPSSRATEDGVVVEVIVKPGDFIYSNDIVAKIEVLKKE